MSNKENNQPKDEKNTGDEFPGYPQYPAKDDIYAREKEEEDIDPEDLSKSKPANMKAEEPNEKSFNKDKSGDDLDVPGAELDDEDEAIGEEDEENNSYSLGGDNHDDLEEDKGD